MKASEVLSALNEKCNDGKGFWDALPVILHGPGWDEFAEYNGIKINQDERQISILGFKTTPLNFTIYLNRLFIAQETCEDLKQEMDPGIESFETAICHFLKKGYSLNFAFILASVMYGYLYPDYHQRLKVGEAVDLKCLVAP